MSPLSLDIGLFLSAPPPLAERGGLAGIARQAFSRSARGGGGVRRKLHC